MCEKSFDDVDVKSVQSELNEPVICDALFPGEPIYTMVFAAGTLVIAAVAMMRVSALTNRSPS